MTSSAVEIQERRAALARVLASHAFERSEQLRAFLRYVCEQELAGAAAELTEYRIGVRALGRPEDFSPSEDSIVRNRAHALRKKLDEFYAAEGQREPVRIELPKGSYAPRFHSGPPHPSPAPVAPPRPSRRGLVLAAAAGAVAGALGTTVMLRKRLRPEPPAPLAGLWGPMLDDSAPVTVCVATPPHVFLRPQPEGRPSIGSSGRAPAEIEAWYRRLHPEHPFDLMAMVPSESSPLWGDAAGALLVTRALERYGQSSRLLAERLVQTPALAGANVVLLGNAEYSPTVRRSLEGLPFEVAFDRERRDYVVWRKDAAGQVVQRWVPERDEQAKLKLVHGLLTVMPDGRFRRVVIGGISSAGTIAAAEFFTSVDHLAALQSRLGGKWPRVLQVVVRARTDKTLPLDWVYETHAARD
jgi:hypothetical protein